MSCYILETVRDRPMTAMEQYIVAAISLQILLCLFLIDRISSFQKRSDATNVSLLFNAQQQSGDQEPFAGLGYHLTPPASPPQAGHGGYYAIVSCPAVEYFPDVFVKRI